MTIREKLIEGQVYLVNLIHDYSLSQETYGFYDQSIDKQKAVFKKTTQFFEKVILSSSNFILLNQAKITLYTENGEFLKNVSSLAAETLAIKILGNSYQEINGNPSYFSMDYEANHPLKNYPEMKKVVDFLKKWEKTILAEIKNYHVQNIF